MTYTAWSADGRVVPINDRFASGLFIETWTPINEQKTARISPHNRAGGVESVSFPDSAPTSIHDGPSLTREPSKAAAPTFSGGQ